MCSNPKITRLAQLQWEPHYTASRNRGRNTRPIQTKWESRDVRKHNISMAGVDLTLSVKGCPGAVEEKGAYHILSCPRSGWQHFLHFTTVFHQECHWPPLLSLDTLTFSTKYYHKKRHSSTRTLSLSTRGLSCGQAWLTLGLCQRSVFMQGSSK